LQVLKGYDGATWDNFMSYVTFGTLSPYMPATTAQAVAKKVADLYAFTKPSAYQDQDLADILYDIKARSYPHSRIVFVPHSQGNLYANLVYDKLIAEGVKPKKSLGVVGIAVPYSSVRSGNTYITSGNDFVIDMTRIVGSILGPNITIPYQPLVDVLGHNLINIYLANSTVKSMLISRMTSEFGALKTTAPDPTGGIMSQAHAYKCGEIEGGPYAWTVYVPACKVGIPDDRTTPTWHKNVIMNYFLIAGGGEGYTQHAYGTGTFAELEAYNKAHSTGCYNWWIADRKAWITKHKYVPYSGNYEEFNTYPSCGPGFPRQTPYGNPDAAWKIYSADTYKYVSNNQTSNFAPTGEVVFWNNQWTRQAVCNR